MRALPPAPPPVEVHLEANLGCNLRCPMCAPFRTGLTAERRSVGPELLGALRGPLRRAARLGLSVAAEPLMDPELPALVRLAGELDLGLVIATNGTVLPRADAELDALLARSALILVSLDAADPEVYEAQRGRGLHARVLGNLRRLVAARARLPRRRRPALGASVVLNARTIDGLPALVDLAADLGLDLVQGAHQTIFTDDEAPASLAADPARADARFAAAAARARARGLLLELPPPFAGPPPPPDRAARLRVALRAPGLLRDLPRRLQHRAARARWERAAGGRVPCPFLMGRVYVSIDGHVSPCCMPGRPVVGDLREAPLEQIWDGPAMTALRRAFLDGRPEGACAHCAVNPEARARPDDGLALRPPGQQLVAELG